MRALEQRYTQVNSGNFEQIYNTRTGPNYKACAVDEYVSLSNPDDFDVNLNSNFSPDNASNLVPLISRLSTDKFASPKTKRSELSTLTTQNSLGDLITKESNGPCSTPSSWRLGWEF